MLRQLLILAIVAAVGYWYWSGPYQERVNPTYEQQLRQNSQNMHDCMYRKNYAGARMLKDAGDTETICSAELNLYQEDGQWHSYDATRH